MEGLGGKEGRAVGMAIAGKRESQTHREKYTQRDTHTQRMCVGELPLWSFGRRMHPLEF